MNAMAKRAARAVFSALPFDPGTMWRELSDDQRTGFRALLEAMAGARELGPPEPPAELRAQFQAAAAAHSVPAALLSAIAWELSGYDADAPRGLMGLNELADQVNAAAFVLRRLSDDHGLAIALRKITGDQETAGRIVGTMALIMARRVDTGGYENARQALEILES